MNSPKPRSAENALSENFLARQIAIMAWVYKREFLSNGLGNLISDE